MQSRLSEALTNPGKAALFVASTALNLALGLRPSSTPNPGQAELAQIYAHASKSSDISDHLPTLFAGALEAQPKLIVELGVRGGDSTFVLERVARLCNATLVSVDIDDCSRVSSWDRWHFVRQDDVSFAADFPAWCREHGGIEPAIDVLFIDTSHMYAHTCQEIAAWLPLVAPRGRVFFHDTNMHKLYFRRDGSSGIGWDNQRGVIRAIEEHLNTHFDETRDFVDIREGWLVRHQASCSGFTQLLRLPSLPLA